MAVLRFRDPRNQVEIGYKPFLEKIGVIVTGRSCTLETVLVTLESMYGIHADKEIIAAALDFMHAMGYLTKDGEVYNLALKYR